MATVVRGRRAWPDALGPARLIPCRGGAGRALYWSRRHIVAAFTPESPMRLAVPMTVLSPSALAAPVADFFVAMDGSDANPGSLASQRTGSRECPGTRPVRGLATCRGAMGSPVGRDV